MASAVHGEDIGVVGRGIGLHPQTLTELKLQVQHALGDYYRLDDELTGGGMSRLFMATEVSLNRRVVVKVLPPEWASDVSAARFKREMEVAAQLQHPHILPVLAAGARTGLLYYIMPYVSGESLRSRLKRDGALPIVDAQRILTEIADALAFAHERGVIHRDIKPENILLEGRHAVLADFGVARALLEARTGDGNQKLTSTGSSVGTPGYMSPEQVAGDVIDARADVYALAVVGYEMVAGQPPFTGPTPQAILKAHLADTPEPLRTLRPECPLSLQAAIARALSKEPAQRFASAAEFLAAVSDGTAPRQRRITIPRRTLLVAAGVVALLALGVTGVRQRSQARALIARATPAADSARLDDVYRIFDSAGADVGAGRYSAIADRVAGTLSLDSVPPGMTASVTRAHPVASFSGRRELTLGRAPISRKLVAGEYYLRLVSATDTLERMVNVARGGTTAVSFPRERPTPGMVRVPAGKVFGGHLVPPLEIGRYEVTNAEYQRFVDAGSYRNMTLWPDSMFVDRRWRSRNEALALFVDRSGLPGPRVWSGGKAPSDQMHHPVVAVSWYEAAAYARWAKAELPTTDQWWRAAREGEESFPWGNDGLTVEQRANFGLAGTSPVGSMRLSVSPYGAHDMAGNVREWIADVPDATHRIVVGGSWQDPTYMFEPQHAEHFEPGYASPVIGFRIARPSQRQ